MKPGERIHFIGIGGAGMSAIAAVLIEMGVQVSGSDLKESRYTQRLQEMGAQVCIGHRPENVEGAGMVVYSSAIGEENREMKRARELGLELIPRAEMLGRLMADKRGIAVAGTHGKTTTTSMISKILCDAGWDPTCIIGGELNDIGSNARYGKGVYLVAEADESDGSFLLLSPYVAVITNIEEDHHDFYDSWEKVQGYYSSFLQRVVPGGAAVLNGDDRTLQEIPVDQGMRKIFFGKGGDNEYRFTAASYGRRGSEFDLLHGDEVLGRVKLRLPGEHNVRNALAAAATAHYLGVEFPVIRESIQSFNGVHRRFERVGRERGVNIIDDYAHHPTEVRATLGVAREVEGSRVVCIFQPHRYSRTAALWREFGKALGLADVVILTEVYGAGELPAPGVSAKLILDALLEEYPYKEVVYIPKRSELGRASLRYIRPGDVVLTMGAGDVTQCSTEILAALKGG